MRSLFSLIALLIMASRFEGQVRRVSEAWQRAVSALPADPERAAASLNRIFVKTGIPLTYWVVQDSAERLLKHPPADLELSEHPCGAVAFVQAPRIPRRDGRLQPEHAVELDQAGRELRRWLIPTDEVVLGLRADELIVTLPVPNRSDLALAVRLNGQYKAVAWASAPASAVVDCPPNEGFGESVYVRCLQVPAQDGTTHFLAYQGPCT